MKERLWISRRCSTDQAPQQEQDTAHTDELPEYATDQPDIHGQQAIVQNLLNRKMFLLFKNNRIAAQRITKQQRRNTTQQGRDIRRQ